MAAKRLDQDLAQTIIAEWRTGAFSQQDLADRHRVSKGVVNKLCKGIAQDTASLVTAGIQYRTGLAAHDDRNVTAVLAVVEERTKNIQFFNDATIHNIKRMMDKVGDGTTVYEHALAQKAIKDGKETVLGKTPDTEVNLNQNNIITRIERVLISMPPKPPLEG
ncbi:MAG: hypothetical protein ACLQHK_01215 [Gallionellaceae bacterium]